MAHSEIQDKAEKRIKRGRRVRKHIREFAKRPRLAVVKSNKHLQAQIIDKDGQTLCGTATYSKEFRNTEFNKKGKASAQKLGEHIAKLASEKGIKEVVLDRGASSYHGVVGALADAARQNGLEF